VIASVQRFDAADKYSGRHEEGGLALRENMVDSRLVNCELNPQLSGRVQKTACREGRL
jgi:hypothetical protein